MAACQPNAPRCPNHRRNFDAYPRNAGARPKFEVVNNQAEGATVLDLGGAFALLNSRLAGQNRGLRTTLASRKQFEFGKTTSTSNASPEKLTA
jgi:hypothetical protein